jgi:hypothetical protein
MRYLSSEVPSGGTKDGCALRFSARSEDRTSGHESPARSRDFDGGRDWLFLFLGFLTEKQGGRKSEHIRGEFVRWL